MSSLVSRTVRSSLLVFFGVLLAGGLLLISLLLFVLSQFDGSARIPAECVVVFGAAVHQVPSSGGVVTQAGPAILRRVATAADLYRNNLAQKLFLTGGKGEGMRQSEAEVMRTVAIADGVEPGDIVLEDRSRSTEENIRFTMPLTASCSTVLAVSDRYHLARIRFLAWRAGWGIETYPASAPIESAFEAQSIVREVLALLYEGVTGR